MAVFNVDSGLILWEVITFILLLVTLRLYAWKPLVRELRKREIAIQQAIDQAEQARGDAEIVLRSSRDALEHTLLEFDRIRQRSEPLINQIKNVALDTADGQVNRILSETTEEIQRVKERAIQQCGARSGNWWLNVQPLSLTTHLMLQAIEG